MLALFLTSGCTALPTFEQFSATFNKAYTTEAAEAAARAAYEANLLRIQALNADPQDRATYGINKFADMTPAEFKANYHPGLKRPDSEATPKCSFHTYATDPRSVSNPPPDSFDWRSHGAVTPIKDQGHW